jgi:hypothetical protein
LYRLSLTLDAFLKFGTLAERTDKQPGVPGTQQSNALDGEWRAALLCAIPRE